MRTKIILLIPTSCLLFASCNLDKRLYRNGYYLHKNSTTSTFAKNDETTTSHINEAEVQLTAATSNSAQEEPTNSRQLSDNVLVGSITPTTPHKSNYFPEVLKPSTVDNEPKPGIAPLKSNSTTAASPNDPGDGMSARNMLTLGWVFTGIAILSLFFYGR